LLAFLAIVPLVAAQRNATAVALSQGSTEDRNTRLTPLNWVGVVAMAGIFVFLVLAAAIQNSSPGTPE
jgi:TolB-like protein